MGAGALAADNSVTNSTIKSQAASTTSFLGEWTSLGGALDLSFDGVYSLLTFHQNGAA